MTDVKVIDATGKRVGRLATLVATHLMGKDDVLFLRHKHPLRKVLIKNASGLDISPGKQRTKIYSRYSGYPGGLKQETMGQLIKRRGHGEMLRRAIYGMLPANKLRAQMMKKVTIEN